MSYNHYNPSAFPLNEYMIIAPYWADVDTTEIGQIYFRETNDSALLAIVADDLTVGFPTSNVTKLIIVTWKDVGYFDKNTDKVC